MIESEEGLSVFYEPSQYAMIQSEGGGVIISDIKRRGALNTKRSNQERGLSCARRVKKDPTSGSLVRCRFIPCLPKNSV